MTTYRPWPQTCVRQYRGKHAEEHFRRHAAYMATRGWVVVGSAQREGATLIVTFRQQGGPGHLSRADVFRADVSRADVSRADGEADSRRLGGPACGRTSM